MKILRQALPNIAEEIRLSVMILKLRTVFCEVLSSKPNSHPPEEDCDMNSHILILVDLVFNHVPHAKLGE
jgi:hypothetical protein